ncbi:MAG: DUF2306 domain-containing protein [Bacteroidia bacterium]
MQFGFKQVFNSSLLIAAVYFLYLMLLITLQYIPINFNVAFLRIKNAEIELLYYQIAFFTHVYSSIFVLGFGIIQLIPWVRKNNSKWHKTFGKFYVGITLFLSAPSGFIMAIHANGGIWGKTSFLLLSILWFYFTLKAFLKAKKGEWEKHQNFMYRSFALTFSAVSLRLFKWILANTLALPPMDMYVLVSWLGWTINLLIVELKIVFRNKRNGSIFAV